jgi:hypothetical protein
VCACFVSGVGGAISGLSLVGCLLIFGDPMSIFHITHGVVDVALCLAELATARKLTK